MSKLPVLIFDADGVLLDSLAHACKAFNDIADAKFPELPRVETKEDMALVYPGPLSSSLRRFGLSKERIKQFFELHTSAMRQVADEVAPFDAVIDGIRKFGYGRSAIVSSAYNETILATLMKSKFYEPGMFTHIRGREPGKDKSEKIKEVLTDFSVRPDHAIYFGDTVSDILYCKSVPIKVAAVGYGYHPANYLAAFDPDFLFPDCMSLISFLGGEKAVLCNNPR
jgi:phosphoglycolate phosphatase-like HAD superfamily hydrolase